MDGQHIQSNGQCGALAHSARRCPFFHVVIVLAVLGLHARAQAANDFTGDPNLVMQYRFESGALTTDTFGGNTLTNSGGAETATCMEGACAVDLEDSEDDYLYIADASLPANFPYKNGTTANKSFSVCFWFRPESGSFAHIITKGEAGNYSWFLSMDSTDLSLRVSFGRNSTSGTTFYAFDHASGIALNQWYHVGMTYNDPNRAVRLRIWDETASAMLGTDRMGTMNDNVWAGDAEFCVGRMSGETLYDADGIVDELLVWNCWLRTDEIDDVRAGSYVYSAHGQAPPPPPPPGGYLFYLDNSASGANDGTSLVDAWETWADAAAGLAAEPDKGGGCTLIVSEGTGASYGVIERASVLRENRADWLTIQAAEGESPLFDQIVCGSASIGDIRDVKLILDGLTIYGQGEDFGPLAFLWVRYVTLRNLDVSTPGVVIPGGKYSPQYESGSSFNVRNGLIEYCDFHHGRRLLTVQAYGGWYPDEVRIRNNVFRDNADDGLNLNGTNLDVWDNHFYDPNRFHTHLDLRGTIYDGPFVAGEIVQQDTTGAQGYYMGVMSAGISVWQFNATLFVDIGVRYTVRGLTSGAYILNTDVDYCHQDCCALDTGSATGKLDFQRNLFDQKNVGTDSWSQGLKINAKTFGSEISDVNVVNNVFLGTGGHGLLFCGILNLKMWNNLVATDTYFETSQGTGSQVMQITELYNNVFLHATNNWEADAVVRGNKGYIQYVAHGNNYFNGAPSPASGPLYPYVLASTERASVDFSTAYFTDYANRDYTLVQGSQLINAGYAVGAPTIDCLGNSRGASPDIGPYERLTPPPPAAKPWRHHRWRGHMP